MSASCEGSGRIEITRFNVRVPLKPKASTARTVTAKVPEVLAVPCRRPSASSATPAGKVPSINWNW